MADTSVATPNKTHNPWPHTPVFTDTVTVRVVFFFFGDLLDVAEKVDPIGPFLFVAGYKESQFYSLPFRQALSSIYMYQPKSHFNLSKKNF